MLRNRVVVVGVLALCLLFMGSAGASAQIKPRFTVIFDTSGSMLWDLNNEATWGDGVGRLEQGGDDPALVRDGVFYGCGTTAGLDRDCDGLPNDSKTAVAKEAVRNMINGFGDVEWSLMRFYQDQGTGISDCKPYADGDNACDDQGFGNPQCNTGGDEPGACIGNIPAACRPGVGTIQLQDYSGGDFAACIGYNGTSGGFGGNCDDSGNEGNLLVGFPGFAPFDTIDNRPAILKWMDNIETADDSVRDIETPGNYCDHAGLGNCELRADGNTPLGRTLLGALGYIDPIRTGDTESDCRPYSVILITDGEETCDSDSYVNARATELYNAGVQVYVVGISIVSSSQTSLNNIALAGSGNTQGAFFAANRTELAAALSEIVQDSIFFEVCDGEDNDCDDVVDEDIPLAAPGADNPESLSCDGEGNRTTAQNDQVNLRPDYSGLMSTDPLVGTANQVVCGKVDDTCANPDVDDDCDGALDEDDPGLVDCGGILKCPVLDDPCDGQDNDCDGNYDEGMPTPNGSGGNFDACPQTCVADVPCGRSTGLCELGVYRCIDGVLDTSVCFGEVGPAPFELCDNEDNDCDGLTDEQVPMGMDLDGDTGGASGDCCGSQCLLPDFGPAAICAKGVWACNQGNWECNGERLPEDREQCDLVDHDCDGDTFTCTDAGCVSPDPEGVGDSCGDGRGICTGTLSCLTMGDPPELVCDAPLPGANSETCDGVDEDCDGIIDEDPAAGPDSAMNDGGPVGDDCDPSQTYPDGVGICVRSKWFCSNGLWGCSTGQGPRDEICNGLNDDCDSDTSMGGELTDEDTDGDANTDGTPGNHIDANDPRMAVQCGSNVGECVPGDPVCIDGSVDCTPVNTGIDEICDGLDNDCDYSTDEDTAPEMGMDPCMDQPTAGLCEPGSPVCTLLEEDPDVYGFECRGGVGPQAELCDGEDNDCDGDVDECIGEKDSPEYMACDAANLGAGGGTSCGVTSPMGCTRDVDCVCQSGVERCVADTGMGSPGFICDGEIQGTDELCNGVDDDCDGATDEDLSADTRLRQQCHDQFPDLPEDGILENLVANVCHEDAMGLTADPSDDVPCGKCRFGLSACVTPNVECQNFVLPDEYETCNLTDDDCDGEIDECLYDGDPTCDPGDVFMDMSPVNTDCGDGGCESGRIECRDGSLECIGFEVAAPEICDGIDNDCNGIIDDPFNIGGPCGTNEGECVPGVLICDPDDPMGDAICTGDIGPSEEICDALDNNCNGEVDEGLGLGDECGTDEGLCEFGRFACVDGSLICEGEVTPSPETCDCSDNDCDGNIDEEPGDTNLCGGRAACVMCQCALPCAEGMEFLAQCPQGKAAVTVEQDGADRCYCVGEQCRIDECGEETIEVEGEVVCQPDSDNVAACTCKNNECVEVCSGVVCGDGLVCDRTDGRCKQESCLLKQFECPGDQRCQLEGSTWRCVDDPCAEADCADGEACRAGTCLKSCATVQCEDGNKCEDGNCVPDRCFAKQCDVGEVCNPADGECVLPGECVRTGCPDGEVCDPVGGECSEDPCLSTRCPYGEQCNSETSQCEPRCFGALLFCDDACINPQTSKQHCGASGDCMGDAAGSECADDEVCSRGECSESCADGLLNCGGECIDPQSDQMHCGASDDCMGDNQGSVCQTGFVCMRGSCRSILGDGTDDSDGAGGEGVGEQADVGTRVIASGGGGCTCTVPVGAVVPAGDAPASRRGPLALALVGLALIALGRRRRFGWLRRVPVTQLLLLGTLAASLLLGGCTVDPFCLDCPSDEQPLQDGDQDGGASGGPFSDGGSGTGRPGDGTDDPLTPTDGGTTDATILPDACGVIEVCNGVDDDCDGVTDEDVDPAAQGLDYTTDIANCGGCGNACRLDHAFPACEDSTCKIDRTQGENGCDVGFFDLDGDDENGCEYRCTVRADDDSVCDLVDDDCDGKTDEDIDFQSDANNCGSCGRRCRFASAAEGGVCSEGECTLDNTKCDDGFRDLDGQPENGCEKRCPVWPTVGERCDLLDQDCDGVADEDVDNTTDERIGIPCGDSDGECVAGTQICVNGTPTCDGAIGPTTEVCDGLDNDCDEVIDTDHPDFGKPCGISPPGSECRKGTLGLPTPACSGGVEADLVCIGDQGPVVELCDGLDNDCDGQIDNMNASDMAAVAWDATARCESTDTGIEIFAEGTRTPVGECAFGVPACQSANIRCEGEQGPVEEVCDGDDNDCDGRVDECAGEPGDASYDECELPANDWGAGGGTLCGVTAPIGCTPGVDCVCEAGRQKCDPNGAGAGMPGLICDGEIAGTDEVCDGVDNDCDGQVDNDVTDTLNEACVTVVCTAVGVPDPACTAEDVGRPIADTTSGNWPAWTGSVADPAVCRLGSTQCTAGRIACVGASGPEPFELCDDVDRDCDGALANDGTPFDSRVGQPCGPPNVGVCTQGTTVCDLSTPSSPQVSCSGAAPSEGFVPGSIADDLCDGVDDDCDGTNDEDVNGTSDTRVGVACSTSGAVVDLMPDPAEGACSLGTSECNPISGTIICTGEVRPGTEVCSATPHDASDDEDCDGTVDENFNTATNLNHCGACNNACLDGISVDPSELSGTIICSGSACVVNDCDTGFVDANDDWTDGCETECTVTGGEVCDGVDNDCNTVIDDVDVVPTEVCVPLLNGVCRGRNGGDGSHLLATGPSCTPGNGMMGTGTLECDVSAAFGTGDGEVDSSLYEEDEVSCDGFDNDCDGLVDEVIPEIGLPCSVGVGECRRLGTYQCDAGAMDGFSCRDEMGDPVVAGDPGTEICDGLDNNCNGTPDDFGVPTVGSPVTNILTVSLPVAPSDVLMMRYEASRPDATVGPSAPPASGDEGSRSDLKPCSAPNRLPWANVTWDTAAAACCRLNADGQCTGDGSGWRLCEADDWEVGCRGVTGTCDWAYSDSGNECDHSLFVSTYDEVCVGAEALESGGVSCQPGDDECATVTGSSVYDQCFAEWGSDDAYDLSGNVQEWTATAQGSNIYEMRGGSYNDSEIGRSCGFDFVVASNDFRFPNTGFRCCSYPTPTAAPAADCSTVVRRGGHEYTVCTTARTQSAARAVCTGSPGGLDLVRIDDFEENAFVVGLLAGSEGWIGADDMMLEGDWRWNDQANPRGDQFWSGDETGSAVGGLFEAWGDGEPNDSGGEHCATMRTDGFWNDLDCGNTRAFVCESLD